MSATYVLPYIVDIINEEEFKVLVDQGNPVIAFFYDSAQMKSDEHLRMHLIDMIESFRKLSEFSVYRDVGLIFLLVDVSEEALKAYSDKFFKEGLPSYVIFTNKLPIKNIQNKVLSLHGIVPPDMVASFINTYLADIIDFPTALREFLYEEFHQPVELPEKKEDFYRNPYIPESYWGDAWGPVIP